MTSTGGDAGGGPAAEDTPGPSPWAAEEEAVLNEGAREAEADAAAPRQYAATKPGRWNPFRRERHNLDVQRVEMDDDQARFDEGVEADVAAGRLAVPAGGPITPAEESDALEHPWPGHSYEETVARNRQLAAGASGAPAAPAAPRTGTAGPPPGNLPVTPAAVPAAEPEMNDGGLVNRGVSRVMRGSFDSSIGHADAAQADEGTEEAARAAGETAAEADTERRTIEAQAAGVARTAPGSAAAQDAAAAAAQAEQDANQAIAASLDADQAAVDAKQSVHVLHSDTATGEVAYQRATGDLGAATKDLTDEDRLEQRVEADEAAVGIPPPPAPPS